MTTPQFLITTYFEESKGDFEDFSKKLYKNGVMTKKYDIQGLTLVYHKYDTPVTNDLARECRSLVIDNDGKVLSYSCMMPLMNKEGLAFLEKNADATKVITPCYEGTYLSVFHHNDKWYVSTRRCLDSSESYFNQNNSHYNMFLDVLAQAGYDNFNSFTSILDPTRSYYFVLIHYLNKHVLDYSTVFGDQYMRLCLTTVRGRASALPPRLETSSVSNVRSSAEPANLGSPTLLENVRDSNMSELDIYTDKVSFASYDITGKIFVPTKLESITESTPFQVSEGVVVKVYDTTKGLYNLIKLQSTSYQFALVVGSDNNLFKGLIYLYQNNLLLDYFSDNKNSNVRKIVNPLNTNESYDSIGMVDAVFKVCTSELFELFKLLFNVKDGKQQNKELYSILPKEYKDMMFGVRGLYYKKKATMYASPERLDDIRSSHLKISDIYNYMKSIPTEMFISFLQSRKLMFNWTRLLDSNITVTSKLSEFSTISNHSDKVHIKLTAIFTNKLFPGIMPTDVPQIKDTNPTQEIPKEVEEVVV